MNESVAHMDHEHHHGHDFGGAEGWAEMNHGYNAPQHQPPMYDQGAFGYIQPLQNDHHGLPTDQTFHLQRISLPLPPQSSQQQLLPHIMPSQPTWPSMLTHPAIYPAPPVAIPATAAPLVRMTGTRLPALHTASPRKTLTDSDRRRMCQYNEENPTVKQTEIGAMFGVERSTVSKVLRHKDKYLFPEDRTLSPVKRPKGKFPDVERALSQWARKEQEKGNELTDHDIKNKVMLFTTTAMGNTENQIKINSASWLEKFKQKNGIGSVGKSKLVRKASDANVSDTGSLNMESANTSTSQTSASHTPNGRSPISPAELTSPSSLSCAKSSEDLRSDTFSGIEFGAGNGGYRHSNSQSATSLSSIFTDSQAPGSFSGGPTSPTTPFSFASDSANTWLPYSQARLPISGNFQRPRSQTFPNLGIDPSFMMAHGDPEPLTPKYHPITAPSSALDSPMHEMSHPFGMDSAISSPVLHHSSSNGSMAPPSGTPIMGLHSPPGSTAPSSPTRDDACRALDTLLNYFIHQPHGLVDHNEYTTVLKMTERLRLQASTALPGGLHRIVEQDYEIMPKMEQAMKMEQSMSPNL